MAVETPKVWVWQCLGTGRNYEAAAMAVETLRQAAELLVYTVATTRPPRWPLKPWARW